MVLIYVCPLYQQVVERDVMLSKAKHLLAGYVRVVSCRLYVILSATKDLKVCTTIHCLGDLEILHSVQNDRVSIQNDNTWRVIARTLVRGNLSHVDVGVHLYQPPPS